MERADQPSSYGIHLNADGLQALHACLPSANWEQLIDSAVPARAIVRFHDDRLHVLAVRDNQTPRNISDPITRRRAISRDALRDALLLGLNHDNGQPENPIRWGRQFTGYEHGPDSRLRVHCGDGAILDADLLVGADGSNSRVRAQLLPGLDRQELDIITIAGPRAAHPRHRRTAARDAD